MFDNLRDELIKKPLTMKSYAEFLGVSEKTLQNKINGVTDFTLSEVEKTCKFLFPKIRVETLFFSE